jgi:DNA repair photolyase
MSKVETYKYPIALTQQFIMCGNSFRADTYSGCDFGCKYCFANNRGGGVKKSFLLSDIGIIRSVFKNCNGKSLTSELIKNKVPLHLGGMADPFQERELEHGVTKEFLKLSSAYKYPVNISTKTGKIPEDYFDILNPEIHTFQVSLIGTSNEYIRRFETNTPLPHERIELIKKLKSKGFWVSVRIQPLIKIDEAINVIRETENFVDYYTIEHLKLPYRKQYGDDSQTELF